MIFILKDSVFHGVVRFYLQDHISGNCATKCICISSTTTAQEVIETLLEKFQCDGTLNPFPYSLYEVLKNQGDSNFTLVWRHILSLCCQSLNVLCFCHLEERQLDLSEKPLMVQLSWSKDKDGRFVLRNDTLQVCDITVILLNQIYKLN